MFGMIRPKLNLTLAQNAIFGKNSILFINLTTSFAQQSMVAVAHHVVTMLFISKDWKTGQGQGKIHGAKYSDILKETCSIPQDT